MRGRTGFIYPVLLLAALYGGWLLGGGGREGVPREAPRDPSSSGSPGVTSFDESSRREVAPLVVSGDEYDAITVYEKRNESVVNVNTETVVYNWFLEAVPREGSSGSGSIIDSRGFVLTNDHVVEGASRVFVTLADGSRLEGDVAGRDPENDLAVIRFDPGERVLEPIPFGDSSSLRIGQTVLAIGNPFGLDRTLTAGVVSGLGRPLRARNNLVIRDMIQTDASINPGNSGGPLLNRQGEMVGVNTAIFSPSGGSVGIGFAVPVSTVRRVVPDLIAHGQVRRGWIDIEPRQLFPQLVQYAGLPVDRGVLIHGVDSGGNAREAGLQGGSRSRAVRYGRTVIHLGGDIIVGIDETAVETLANLYEALEDKRPGDTVRVRYYRGRELHETAVVLSERPRQYSWD